jgi:2Fe-2S ferredoxin
MPKVTFIQTDGKRVVVEDAVGTLMEIATDNEVEGITGDCGGVCSCSTCHIYISPDWQDKVGDPEELEMDTLDFNEEKKPNSRLGCQVEVTEALDGLVVEVAPEE